MAGWALEAGTEQLVLDGFRPAPLHHAQAELARFRVKVVVDARPGGCHHWIGAIGDDGYGRFQAGAGARAQTVHAHRWAWEHAHGLRPTRLRLLHSCDETGCVNPDHLAPGTQAENMAHMHQRGRAWRRHSGSADRRGPAGRARAIRAALGDGWHEMAFLAALDAGDPFADQLTLPVVLG